MRNHKRGQGGFTLVEILVAIAILGFLVTMAVSSFKEINEKYKVEAETKQLYADLMDARGRAMQRNRVFFVRISANGYETYEDSSPPPDGNGTWDNTTDTPVASVSVKHAVTADAEAVNFFFDRNGIAAVTGTGNIRFPLTANADYDCITIRQTRIKMGKFSAGDNTCVEK